MSYVVGEGPIDSVYEDVLFLAECGKIDLMRSALSEASRRHYETALALQRATTPRRRLIDRILGLRLAGVPATAPVFHLKEAARREREESGQGIT